MQSFFIFLFASLGILLRLSADKAFAGPTEKSFPWSTFWVNISGCALASLIYIFLSRQFTELHLQALWLLSFCIGFTLFSAYTLHAIRSYEKNKSMGALIYFLISPTSGLLIAFGALAFIHSIRSF